MPDLERQVTEKDVLVGFLSMNLLIKIAMAIIVLIQMLMTIMTFFTKELKILIILFLWVKIIKKMKVIISSYLVTQC